MTVEQLGRAYATYRRTAGSRSMVVLLAANAIPLIGVLFFGWSLLTILVIYWLENGIVGFWNVPKIVLAQGSIIPRLPALPDSAALAATGNPEAAERLQAEWQRARAAQLALSSDTNASRGPSPQLASLLGSGRLPTIGRAGIAVFFLIHYGMFWLVHGIFVFALPTFGGLVGGGSIDCGPQSPFEPSQPCVGPFGEVLWTNVAIAAGALFISHGASFLFNYIGRGEYLTASPTRQTGAPYGRVVVLHLTILFGAFAVALFGSPIWALLILVVLKTGFDLSLHLREHRNEGPAIGSMAPDAIGAASAVEPGHPE